MFKLTPKTISLTSSNVAASTESEYDDTATYATGDVVKVSYESDGTTPRTPVKEYESLADSNSGNYPPDSPTKWSGKGATNRWKMFDNYVLTQTENADTIEVKVESNKVSHFALFELDATDIEWWLYKEDGTTVVKSGTIDLTLASPVGSVTHKSDIVQAVEAWVYDGYLEIHINKTGSTAKCGHMVIGYAETIGENTFGAETDLLDYSKYKENDSGYKYLSQGNWRKGNKILLQVRNEGVDRALKTIADARATPLVWESNENGTDYEPLLVYGWWSKASMRLMYKYSEFELRLKGMV